MKVERIANRQILFMLSMMRSSLALAFLPVLTAGTAFQDAWLTVIISCSLCVLLVLAVAGLGSKYPCLTVVGYSRRLLGTVGGTIVSLLLMWLTLFIAATDTRVYAEVLSTGFLHNTPLAVLVGTIAFLAALAASSGVEVVGRAADALFPWFLIFIVLTFLAAFTVFEPKNLEPVLARGIGPALTAVPSAVALSAEFVVLTALLPTSVAPEKVTRTALMSLVIAGLVVMGATVMVSGTLTPWLGAEVVFPFFFMTRAISVGRFLQRIESIGVLAWGFGLFVAASTYTYCAAKTLSQILGVSDYRALVGPVAVIWGVMSIQMYEDIFELFQFFRPDVVLPFVAAAFFAPMALLWAAHLVRNMAGDSQSGR